MMERLQKLIAHAGLASRREAEEMIADGRVTVDGQPAHLGQKIDRETARVEVDGVPLPVAPDLVYYLLNKPQGVVSTAQDTHGRTTVVDLVHADTRVYPVGRLDMESEGLILLTNDGTLAELLTHPRFEVEKTYTVLVEGVPSKERLRRLRDGVMLDDGPARAASVRVLDTHAGRALLEIVMREGRNREIRRMCEVVELPVIRLVRTAIGPLADHTLAQGEHRRLSMTEVRSLYSAAT